MAHRNSDRRDLPLLQSCPQGLSIDTAWHPRLCSPLPHGAKQFLENRLTHHSQSYPEDTSLNKAIRAEMVRGDEKEPNLVALGGRGGLTLSDEPEEPEGTTRGLASHSRAPKAYQGPASTTSQLSFVLPPMTRS